MFITTLNRFNWRSGKTRATVVAMICAAGLALGVGGIAVLAQVEPPCPHTGANLQTAASYNGLQEDCGSGLNFTFGPGPSLPSIQGTAPNGDTTCIVSYTYTPSYADCSTKTTIAPDKCEFSSSAYQEMYSGGGCNFLGPIFIGCDNNLTETTGQKEVLFITAPC